MAQKGFLWVWWLKDEYGLWLVAEMKPRTLKVFENSKTCVYYSSKKAYLLKALFTYSNFYIVMYTKISVCKRKER